MHAAPLEPNDFIATFTRQRRTLLARATEVLPPEEVDTSGVSNERVVVTQCLATSLEELKVAEEEMLNQHLELLSTKAESDRKITYWRTLFDLAPVALMLTTADGVIRSANQEMASLLTRNVYHLEGKPLVALIGAPGRLEFRSQLKRVIEVGGVTSWSFTLERKTRQPVNVIAKVQLVPSSMTGTTALYWSVRES